MYIQRVVVEREKERMARETTVHKCINIFRTGPYEWIPSCALVQMHTDKRANALSMIMSDHATVCVILIVYSSTDLFRD